MFFFLTRYISNRCLILTAVSYSPLSLSQPRLFITLFSSAQSLFHPILSVPSVSHAFLFLILVFSDPCLLLTPVSFSQLSPSRSQSLSQPNIFPTGVSFSPLSPSHPCLFLSPIYFLPMFLSYPCLFLTLVSFSAQYISNPCFFLAAVSFSPLSQSQPSILYF